ncbi:MAG: DNA polymerase III subunit beta, partial [Firmicutes bacterium]|nr:DNA polymerase III subunit beta [Bacillota bacterium]
MRFQIKCSDLVSSVAIVERAISTNDQTPALTGLHLAARDNVLTLTANNLQIAVQTKAPCEVLEPGEHLVSGRLFCELVRKLPVEMPVVVE